VIYGGYDLAVIWSDSDEVRFECTDPSEIETLVSMLKQFSQRTTVSKTDTMPSGEKYYNRIRSTSSWRDQSPVAWWLIKQLCARGWEPLGAVSFVYGKQSTAITTDLQYQFKRRTME
jgi:hypothetical protein